GVEPAFAAKAREPRLAAPLHSPEERVVCVVQAFEGCALQTHRQDSGVCVLLPPFGEPPTLVEVGPGHARLAIGIDPLFERRIVELPLRLENRFEGTILAFRW